ncbi:SIS domain-containing protein [bacterium]|nr:SIS domain-containing protein [bacterium]
MAFVKEYFEEVIEVANLINHDNIEKLANDINQIRSIKGRLFFLGVGGSAGNTSHAVNDFRKLCNVECYSPTDNVSELTARTNDEGWETVFSAWLRVSNFNSNDALFILSVGGGNKEKNVSPNLINAVELAKERKASVYGIVGRDDGYVFNNSDICILIPNVSSTRITPHSEEFQSVVWHCLVSHPILQTNKTKW